MKVCTGCGRELPIAEFVRDARRSDGHGAVCRKCLAERVASGKRAGRRRWDPTPWHKGCPRCGEYERNKFPGPKCRHPGAVQGALWLHSAKRVSFVPEGHPDFPEPPPWERASA